MALVAINKHPTRKELTVFGLGLPIVLGLLGWQRWLHGSVDVAWAIWALGGILTITFALVPKARKKIYVGWMYAVFPIAFVVSHLVLAAVYFLVLTPVSLLLRVRGKDPMNRSFDPEAPTYWIPRDGRKRPKSSYFRQF